MKKSLLANIIPVLAGDASVMLEYTYPSVDAIPSGFESLHSEQDGTFHLTGVRGLKTPTDITNLQSALQKERNDHKDTKGKFAVFGDQDINDIMERLDRIGELEAAAGGNLDEDAIDKLVEGRIQTRLNPVNRELQLAQTQVSELSGQVKTYQQADNKRVIADELS